MSPKPKHIPTAEQVRAEQARQAERDRAAKQANIAAKQAATGTAVMPTAGTVVAVPDTRSPREQYLDDIAPAAIVGRMTKFDPKGGRYVTPDDDMEMATDVDYIALCDQTLVGRIKFNGEGVAPDRVMGLLYDGFVMPARESLGDLDQTKWELSDGKPQDPWGHHIYLPLQRGDTDELFTFVTQSITGRRAVGNLLKHYDRLQKTNPDMYPVIRLKVGGFNHRDERVGWVHVPVFAVVGRHSKDSAAKPDSSLAADTGDEIPF